MQTPRQRANKVSLIYHSWSYLIQPWAIGKHPHQRGGVFLMEDIFWNNIRSGSGSGHGDNITIKHGDVIAAAVKFTSANANPWFIGEHPCSWGSVFLLEKGRQGVHNCWNNVGSIIGISHEDGQRIKHGDITTATFASTNVNSWIIGKHPCLQNGVYSSVEEGRQGRHNCWGNAGSGSGIGHGTR